MLKHHIIKNKISFIVINVVFCILVVGGAFYVSFHEQILGRELGYLNYKFELAQSHNHDLLASIGDVFASSANVSTAGVEQGDNRLIPVLFYPDIVDQSATATTKINFENFENQMKALQSAGYQTITLDQFSAFIGGGEATPPREPILLIFGSDSASEYDLIDPFLKALGDHGVMIISHGNSSSSYYLSSVDLADMSQSGRWDVVTSTQFADVTPGKQFTQNSVEEVMPEQEIEVQPGWTAINLMDALSTGSSKSLPFSEDINSSSNDWFIGWGDIQFSNNAVVIAGNGSSTSGGLFLDGSQLWTDYSFGADTDWVTADTVTLYARYHDAANYESCDFSQSNARVIEDVNGTSTQLFEGDSPITTSTINLGIRVIRDKIECLENNQVVAYAYGADSSLASGAIGISAWSKAGKATSVTIQSVSVSAYNTPQEYAQSFDVEKTLPPPIAGTSRSHTPSSSSLTSAASTPQSAKPLSLPVLRGSPLPPPATPIQDLGSPSVFANWTVGTHSAITADTSLYTEGDQSLALTTDGTGDPASAMVLNQGPYNLTNKYLEVWIRVSTTTNLGNLWFVASSDNLHANYYTWKLNEQTSDSVDESEIQAGEWVPIVLTFDSDGTDMVTTGAPNIAALNSFELHVRDKGEASITAWLGGISAVSEPPQGALTIVLDNGWISEYTLAMPTLAKYNFPAVIAEIPETANDPDFMSTAQLQYLQNNLDWDIACHTWDHNYQLGLPTTTISIMDSEFTQCKNWLMENGVGKASNILVWPNGSNSPAAIAEASKYFVTARGIVGTAFNTLPPANPMMLYATEFGGNTPTSTLDADVDRCAANHEWCIFYGHIITTSTPQNQDQYASASFDDFVAHIAADGIPVKTITQVLGSEPYSSSPSAASVPVATQMTLPAGSIASGLSIPYVQNGFANASNWESTWGNFSASSAFLNLGANASTTGATATLGGSSSWTDYKMSATFDWISGQTVGLIARYQNDNNYVRCEFYAVAPGVMSMQLEQYVNGAENVIVTGGVNGDSGVGDKNVNASIEVQGTQGTCSYDNHTISNAGGGYTVSLLSGGIGFTTWDPTLGNSQIHIKSVDVENPY
jgi:peptidoglycan/xylan/chitin deacetylase (PgdA/CDA1 family)